VQSVAKQYGAKTVIGIDVNRKRLDMAKNVMQSVDGVFEPPQWPSTEPHDADAEVAFYGDVAGTIKKDFGLGEGPDVVIDATGAQSAIQTGVQLCKKGGMFVQAGMGREVRSFRLGL
jgi:D-xylulose reductase